MSVYSSDIWGLFDEIWAGLNFCNLEILFIP